MIRMFQKALGEGRKGRNERNIQWAESLMSHEDRSTGRTADQRKKIGKHREIEDDR